PRSGSARNTWPAKVTGLILLADRVRLDLDGQPPALVDVTPAAVADLSLSPGSQVWPSVKATELEVSPHTGTRPGPGQPPAKGWPSGVAAARARSPVGCRGAASAVLPVGAGARPAASRRPVHHGRWLAALASASSAWAASAPTRSAAEDISVIRSIASL